MRSLICYFPVVMLVLGGAVGADERAEWAVKDAPFRVAVHAESPPDIPEAGWQIRLADFCAGRADMRDVVLLDSQGKAIGVDPVWCGPGKYRIVLAESMPAADAPAHLYFGGRGMRTGKAWIAKRSLMLETRRMPAGSRIGTRADWLAAWNASRAVDGVAFVPNIFHGDNPFGDADHFLSRYTGWLKSPGGGTRKFYALSNDVSYVSIDGRVLLQWQKNEPPPMSPDKVPLAAMQLPDGPVAVDYGHAAVDAPGAMVLGWDRGGKLDTVPADAWIHPGRVKVGAVETVDGAPVPLAEVTADQYLGFADQWYFNIRAGIGNPPEGWTVEWLWPDGRVENGAESRRIWMAGSPVTVVVRLRHGQRVCEGKRVLVIPRVVEAASINDDKQLGVFLGLLAKEDPMILPEAARKSGYLLARAFLPSGDATRWADAWLKVAKPQDPQWATAMAGVIRELARNDPRAALARLNALGEAERSALGHQAGLLELEINVFLLDDPTVPAIVARLVATRDKPVARHARIRLGDYHLLHGKTEDAARCFAEAVAGDADASAKAPVIDRSHSLALAALVEGKFRDEARAKLAAWERMRPAAMIDGDLLYWRARVNFLDGDWKRALQDLETSLTIRPGSPEELDVRFWQGRALYELDRKDDARKLWKALATDYPKHERAEAAKSWAEKP